jgi:phosphotransferase system IIA component
VAQTSDVALKKREQWRRVPDAMYAAWRAVGAARAKAFPAACISPRIRKRSVSTSEAGNAVHAGAKKRSRIADDGIDAPLIPDSTAQVLATVDGKVSKLLKSSSGVKKGTPAAILLKDQDQRQMMIAPADGTVTTQHVKEGQPVKAGELLLSIDVSGLSQYVALLNRTPAIRAAVERTAMSDDAASTADRPTRFNLVVALQGVLTARLAMRVIRAPAAGRGAHKTAAGGGDANTGGSSKADAMVVDVEGGEGGDSAGGMVIEAMSMSGVTEVVQPWDASGMAVFRAINREAFSALDRLRARRLRQGAEELRCGQDVVSGLVRWLGSYRALFSSKCVYCKKILVADSCEQEAGTPGERCDRSGVCVSSGARAKSNLPTSHLTRQAHFLTPNGA